VIGCVRLSTPSAQIAWKPTFHRLFSLIERVWRVTRPVISLGQQGPIDGPEGSEKPGHEIARAHEVLGGEDGGDEEGSGDHTGLLSGCWRATSQAG
jgi:hypothetical protein